jgi:ferredoxin
MESPLDVLGLDPDPDPEAVERAYRRRVKEAHPDHGGSAAEFRRVQAAYRALESGEWSEGDGAPASDDGDAAESPDVDPSVTEVEYLDYDAVVDRGWGLADDDLFEKAAASGLDEPDYGRFVAHRDEALLDAAEDAGLAWPYACRGGACANCAVAVFEGEMSQPLNQILPPEMVARGVRLSCNGVPETDTMRVVFNVKHLPDLDDLRLPPYPFENAHGD